MSRYFGITNLYNGESTPIQAEHFEHRDAGWIYFFNEETVVISIPSSGVWWWEMSEEQYQQAVADLDSLASTE